MFVDVALRPTFMDEMIAEVYATTWVPSWRSSSPNPPLLTNKGILAAGFLLVKSGELLNSDAADFVAHFDRTDKIHPLNYLAEEDIILSRELVI